MRNYIYYILYLIVFAIWINVVNWNSVNFNARISDWTSYYTWTSFMDWPINVSTWVNIDFETIISTTSWSWSMKYNFNMPAWFQYQTPYTLNTAVGWWICNPTWIQSMDNIFSLTVPDNACIIELYFKYKPLTSWTHDINLLSVSGSTSTLLNTIRINVAWTNTILNAHTYDSNNNWYLDWYIITLANLSDTWSLSWLFINWTSPTSITATWTIIVWSSTQFIISFTDNTYTSEDTPQLTWNAFSQTYDNSSIIENDTTAPFVSVNKPSWTYTWSLGIILSSTEDWNIYYSTWWTATALSSIYVSWSTITINSNSTLSIFAKDMYSNSNNYSYTYNFACPNSPIANATLSAYPSCSNICNSWYAMTSWVCTVNTSSGGGGGWWGWGWSSTPQDVCPNWDYSWNLYDWTCIVHTTSTWSTSTWTTVSTWTWIINTTISSWSTDNQDISADIWYQEITTISELNIENIDKTFFRNLDEATNYLTWKVTNAKLLKLIESFNNKLTFDWIEYFITYDSDFVVEYNKAINSYVLFFINMDKFLKWENTKEMKSLILNIYNELKIWFDVVKTESLKEKINFTDIEDSFAKKDIIYLALKWIIKWYEWNLFKPNNPITRAEYLAIIMRVFNIQLDENLTETDFSDIPSDWKWMIKYIEKAKDFWIKWQEVESIKYNISGETVWEKYNFIMIDIESKDPSVKQIQELLNDNWYPTAITWIFDAKTVFNLNEFIYEKTWTKYETANLWPQKLKLLNSIKLTVKDTENWTKKIFRPNDPITRWEALAMLFSISWIKTDDISVTSFVDIPSDWGWMIKYIEKAKELWIAKWQIIDWELKFRPNDPITRAESTRVILSAKNSKE